MFFAKKKDLIGIDIGSTSIKLIKLKGAKGSYELEYVGIVPLPSEAIVDNTLMDTSAVVDGLRKLFNDLQIANLRDVASSVSGNSVIIRKITLAAMSAEDLEEEIQWEAEQYIPFDVNDVNIDFQILEPDDIDPSKMFVLLVASKKDIVNDYQSVFAEAGLKLLLVDVDVFALQNAFEMNYDMEPDEVYALVNIGANMMNLNVIKGGISLFTRDVQMGGGLYTEEIQKKLSISGEDAEKMKLSASRSSSPDLIESIYRVNETLSLEIRRSLDFYNSNAIEGRITKVLLSGGGCKSLNLFESVATKLALPVEVINPFNNIKCDEKKFEKEFLDEIAPIMTVAVGLASRRLGDK
ncbi:MAG: type IV pilus assembly protein PilM [Geobacteraceae bacterium]|nr:type IV pilus assembly protein PilM [Geobacteraceae bacterium]